jgi:hypothetical protein
LTTCRQPRFCWQSRKPSGTSVQPKGGSSEGKSSSRSAAAVRPTRAGVSGGGAVSPRAAPPPSCLRWSGRVMLRPSDAQAALLGTRSQVHRREPRSRHASVSTAFGGQSSWLPALSGIRTGTQPSRLAQPCALPPPTFCVPNSGSPCAEHRRKLVGRRAHRWRCLQKRLQKWRSPSSPQQTKGPVSRAFLSSGGRI